MMTIKCHELSLVIFQALFLPHFFARMQFQAIYALFVYLFFKIIKIILTIAERMNTKRKREEIKEMYKKAILGLGPTNTESATVDKHPSNNNNNNNNNGIDSSSPRSETSGFLNLGNVNNVTTAMTTHNVHHQHSSSLNIPNVVGGLSPQLSGTPNLASPPLVGSVNSSPHLENTANNHNTSMDDELWYMKNQSVSPNGLMPSSNNMGGGNGTTTGLLQPNANPSSSSPNMSNNHTTLSGTSPIPSSSSLNPANFAKKNSLDITYSHNIDHALKTISKNSTTLSLKQAENRRGSSSSNISDTSMTGLLVANKKVIEISSRDRATSNVSGESKLSELDKALSLAVPTSSFYEKYPSSPSVKFLKILKLFMMIVFILHVVLSVMDIICMLAFYLWEFFGSNVMSGFFPSLDVYPTVAFSISLAFSVSMVTFAGVNFVLILVFTYVLYFHPDHDDAIKSAILGHPMPSSQNIGPMKVALETIEENKNRSLICTAVLLCHVFVAAYVAIYPLFYYSMLMQGMSFLYQIIFYFGRRIGTMCAILSIYLLYVPFFKMYHGITKIQTTKNKKIALFR